MQRWLALASVVAMLTTGCIGIFDDETADTTNAPGNLDPITQVEDRGELDFVTDEKWSQTLEDGLFDILPAKSVFFDVEVPLGNGLPVQQAHMGVFLPDIPGCDYEAETVPAECQVPVVADVGPYYADGDRPATDAETQRLGGFLIEQLVPHGYAVAQVSVLGTGLSGGCMDLMGEVEQAGVQAAVEELGTAAYSNGNVGLIGRSYDGSTPWEAAMAGSDHLKTVVPISGLYGQHDLMWRNGSAEFRGPGLLWAIYYTFTYSPGEPLDEGPSVPFVGGVAPAPEYAPGHARRIAENAICPDTQTGGAQAFATYFTGEKGPDANAYWHERSFREEVLANYEGSVYFIHGMQDWNVDNHMAFPFYQELLDEGLEMKGLFGQWQHMYPDRPEEHSSCSYCPSDTSVRWDWAQDLLEWFDHYLKGTGAKPQLHVEIQDDRGDWRIEPTYPPQDAQKVELVLGNDLTRGGDGPAIVAPKGVPIVGDGLPDQFEDAPGDLLYRSAPLDQDLRLAGMPTFHVTVTPTGPGGQIYAELRDADDDRRIGHAIMDLRFHAGGEESQPVVPGQPIVAKLQFFALDTVVPAGHSLELYLANTGSDYLPSAVSNPVIVEEGDGSVLALPTIERGPEAFFTPPGVGTSTAAG